MRAPIVIAGIFLVAGCEAMNQKVDDVYYRTLDFAQTTSWDEFLTSFVG